MTRDFIRTTGLTLLKHKNLKSDQMLHPHVSVNNYWRLPCQLICAKKSSGYSKWDSFDPDARWMSLVRSRQMPRWTYLSKHDDPSLVQHWADVKDAGLQQAQNICITSLFNVGPTSKTLGRSCTNVITKVLCLLGLTLKTQKPECNNR